MRARLSSSIAALALVLASPLLGACTGDGDLDPNPVAQVPAPKQDVELVVDRLGITHVYGKSDADAYFGAGYAMARDRLFQMELNRRQARGTAAELLGERAYHDDLSSRVIGFARLGQADAERAAKERPEDYALVAAWASGVNRRIAEIAGGTAPRPYGLRRTELDFVPAPWSPADAYAIGKLLAFGLSDTLSNEVLMSALMRLVPDKLAKLDSLRPAYDESIVAPPPGSNPEGMTPPPAPLPPMGPPIAPSFPPGFVYRDFAPASGSNNWAIDGAHSENGRPLLAGDPHQALTNPGRLWPFHMSSVDGGGSLDVIGFGFVGTPTVELGHNAHVGWTATVAFADVMDLYEVDVTPQYAAVHLGGETRPLTTRVETIRIRKEGAPVGDATEKKVQVHDLEGLGVILPDELLPIPPEYISDRKLFFAWTGFRPTLDASAYSAIDRAEDLDAFDRAADELQVGAVNFIAADAKGITYRAHADVPDRGDPSSRPMPWHVVNGDDPENLWTRGFLPPEQLPHSRAPKSGYLVSANDDPFGFTFDGKVENDPFYYGAFYDKGQRAHRVRTAIERLLENGKKASRADMEALQGDVHSVLADDLVPELLDAVGQIGKDPKLEAYLGRDDLKALAARLGAWDRRFTRDQSDPVVFLGLSWFAAKRLFEAPLTTPLFELVAGRAPPYVMGILRNVVKDRAASAKDLLPDGGVRALMLASLDDTAHWLVDRFGSTDASAYRLRDLLAASFDTTYGGALSAPPVLVDGSMDTVSVAAAQFFRDGEPLDRLTTSTMALYRMSVSFAADGVPEATVDFARGTRGDPGDPHADDQLAKWSTAAHEPLPFRRADVDASATERSTILARAR